MSSEQIAHNIKLFREQNDWTQKELAEKLAVSRSVIAKWENNSVTPDIEALIKLSKVFGITLDHITGNLSFREDLLKDFKRIYSSKSKSFDEEVVELVEYIMIHPTLKEQIYRLKSLPMKKQLSIHQLLSNMIDQYEQI
ncbi:transcriptional regulator with XRE-family HTH domain [Virgibacillus halotolerans]|uniref:helix-turn-helix domain-containing protein n=1 Tax=Virgibacillus halotolerans TaxID=1071053 RepID=UPI0019605BCE|nr:helix-turn-helix transcriptional regulator [Virgibacillus halotolerans]MBM7601950.1 transcriptional regulator with XRE-family HTH domain [Virgibacillus halotolerans]